MRRRHAAVWAGWVVGMVALVGCGSDSTPVAAPSAGLHSKGCVSNSMVIGPLGGTLTAGSYTLYVQAGALLLPRTLTIEQETCGQWPVRLSPDGTQFLLPAFLSFNASGEANPAAMNVAWWNPTTNVWVDQQTYHNGTGVGAFVSHFSRYTVY